jgi:hypothetical protein
MSRVPLFVTALFVCLSIAAQPLHVGAPQPMSVSRTGVAAQATMSPLIASNGESFLVTWVDDRARVTYPLGNQTYTGQAMRVGADGVPLDDVAIATEIMPKGVTWTGSEWLIAGQGGVARVSREGKVLDTKRLPAGIAFSYPGGVAWTGSAAVLIGETIEIVGSKVVSTGVRAVTVDAELNIVAVEQLSDTPSSPLGISGDGQSAMVAWRDNGNVAGASIHVAAFGPDGLLRDKKVIAPYGTQRWGGGAIGSTGRGYVLIYGNAAGSRSGMWIERDLRTRGLGSFGPTVWTGLIDGAPSLAWDGSVLTYYATSSMYFGGPSQLTATRFSADGFLLASEDTVMQWDLLVPSIAAAAIPGRTLLGYLNADRGWLGPAALKLRAFGSFTEFASAREPEAIERGAYEQEMPASASGTTQSLVAWRERVTPTSRSWPIYATRLDRDARVLDPQSLRLGDASCADLPPAIASNGREFLAAWYDANGIPAAVVREDGTFTKTHVAFNHTGLCGQRGLQVVSNGTDFLVLWPTLKNPNRETEWTILGVRMRADGSAIDNSPFDVLETDTSFFKAASNGQDYLVAAHFKAVRVTSEGAVLDRTKPILIAAGYAVRLWWNGTTYVVEMADSNATRFMRIAGDGSGGRSPFGPQVDPTPGPWPLPGSWGAMWFSSVCDASGCWLPYNSIQANGKRAITMIRYDDDGTNITIRAQPTDLTYESPIDLIAFPAGVVNAGRLALLYMPQRMDELGNGAHRLLVAPVVAARGRAVQH